MRKKLKKASWWVIAFIMMLYVLSVSCTTIPVKNHKETDIMVMQGDEVLTHQSLLKGRQQEIFFTFISGKSEGMSPRVYIYGPVWVGYTPQYDTIRIKPNVGYSMKVKFAKPGEAIVLLVWEGEGAFGKNVTLYFKYNE
jgi:hypothetical protein